MARQGWSEIQVDEATHHRLTILKAERKLRSYNALLKQLLKEAKA